MKLFKIILLLCITNHTIGQNPLVSIITSVFKGDQFIQGFMEDIVQQTIFEHCELIIINANSPGNEEPIIKEYMKLFPNIRYIKLDHDPGLYAVWNIGIKEAQAEFVTNANLDDRLAFDCHEVLAKALLEHPEIDLVYSDFYETIYPNETFAKNRHRRRSNLAEYSWPALKKSCLPNSHPMWRKSIHEKYGYFDETFIAGGDWEMWCRAGKHGSLFLKIPGVYGLYYLNPKGLSTKDYRLVTREYKIMVARHFNAKN